MNHFLRACQNYVYLKKCKLSSVKLNVSFWTYLKIRSTEQSNFIDKHWFFFSFTKMF